jgi:hypothetical protein
MAEKVEPEEFVGLVMPVQWCAPFRLQHAGRLTPELAARASTGEISGRLKRSSRTMLESRRTQPL